MPGSWADDPDLPKPPRDTAAARKLIEGAGWQLGADGIYAKGGVRLAAEIVVRSSKPDRVKMADLIALQARDCGMDLRSLPKKWEDLNPGFFQYPHDIPGTKTPFDLYLGGWSIVTDPADGLGSFVSSAISDAKHPDGVVDRPNFIGFTRPGPRPPGRGRHVDLRPGRAGQPLPAGAGRARGAAAVPVPVGEQQLRRRALGGHHRRRTPRPHGAELGLAAGADGGPGVGLLAASSAAPAGDGDDRDHGRVSGLDWRVTQALPPPLDAIERKSLLYRSGLGFWCINHVQGCTHGCRYPCHAFMIAKHYGRVRDYADWCRPRIVANALELLDRELARKRVLPDQVHLCLSTDPFMTGQPEVAEMSLAIVERLNRAGIACSLLSKGVLPFELADRERFPCPNTHGISLVSLDEGFRARWEPGTSPYPARIAALRRLHDAGCRTYAHIEPYPTPNIVAQDLGEILDAVGFVDELFFGRWNYNPIVNACGDAEPFYRVQADLVRSFCRRRGIESGVG